MSKITKTSFGVYVINATGSTLQPGNRVAAGVGEDRDTGRIDSIDGEMGQVSWDSGVRTPLNLSAVDVRVIH